MRRTKSGRKQVRSATPRNDKPEKQEQKQVPCGNDKKKSKSNDNLVGGVRVGHPLPSSCNPHLKREMWGTHFRSNSDVGYGLYLRLRAKGPGLKPDSCVGLFRGLKAAATPGRDAEASRCALRAVGGDRHRPPSPPIHDDEVVMNGVPDGSGFVWAIRRALISPYQLLSRCR